MRMFHPIDIERCENRLLKFCYVPATRAAHNMLNLYLAMHWTLKFKFESAAKLKIAQFLQHM